MLLDYDKILNEIIDDLDVSLRTNSMDIIWPNDIIYHQSLYELIMPDSTYGIFFTDSAIDILLEISSYLEYYSLFHFSLRNEELFDIPKFITTFQKRLAMYIVITIIHDPLVIHCTIDEDMVIDGVKNFIYYCLKSYHSYLVPAMTIITVTDGYAMNLLSQICHVSIDATVFVCNMLKQFIKYNTDPLPDCFYMIPTIPLLDDKQSPLANIEELEIIYQLINSRKNLYVHLLLHTIYQFNRDVLMLERDITHGDIINICQSSWLYIYMWNANKYI